MNNHKTILIYKNEYGWIARFCDDPKVIEAFGTCDIPTPFTSTADPEVVISLLQKRNPGFQVRLAEENEWIRVKWEGSSRLNLGSENNRNADRKARK